MALRRRALWLGVGLAAAAAWSWASERQLQHDGLGCPVRRLLGVACPGCGMTRALWSLARGDWRAALAYHPLAPVFLAEAILLWIVWGVVELGWLRAPRRREVNQLLLADALLLVAVWAWRLLHHSLPPA